MVVAVWTVVQTVAVFSDARQVVRHVMQVSAPMTVVPQFLGLEHVMGLLQFAANQPPEYFLVLQLIMNVFHFLSAVEVV